MSLEQASAASPAARLLTPVAADRRKRVAQLRKALRAASPAGGRTFADSLLEWARPRRLIDLVAGVEGSGAGLLALWLASRACRTRGELVVVDPEGAFYPPAAIAWGVEARRLLVVTPPSAKDALAVTEQALRSPAVGAVWAALGRIDPKAFRRLLLAAEAGEALGVLVRPARWLPEPSWADAQFRVDPVPSPGAPDAPLLVRATQVRNRHGPARGVTTLSLDWRTGKIDDVTQPDANPTPNALPLPAGLAGATGPA